MHEDGTGADVRAAVESWAGTGITEMTELDGGEVGSVYRVDLTDGQCVVAKTAETDLTTEARMLQSLATGGLNVPHVYHASSALLLMEFVDGDTAVTPAVERDLAEQLASLHENEAPTFGFPFDTLSGKLTLPNHRTENWPTFFGEHRLGYMAERAHNEDLLPAACTERLDDLRSDLPALLDHNPTPSLIHGDIWAENLITDGEQVRAFLDPACYYADPEVELAYIEWTGVGGEPFFERYRERTGVLDGGNGSRGRSFATQRSSISDDAAEHRAGYRLLPLLVHLRHFGDEYLEPIRATLAELGY